MAGSLAQQPFLANRPSRWKKLVRSRSWFMYTWQCSCTG